MPFLPLPKRRPPVKKFWQRANRFGTIVLGFVNVFLFVSLTYRWFLSDTIDSPPMTRHDYLDLSLTLLEVILTALTIMLGVLAIVGYNTIKDAAVAKAEEVADALIRAYIGTEARSEDSHGAATVADSGRADPGVAPPTAVKENEAL